MERNPCENVAGVSGLIFAETEAEACAMIISGTDCTSENTTKLTAT